MTASKRSFASHLPLKKLTKDIHDQPPQTEGEMKRSHDNKNRLIVVLKLIFHAILVDKNYGIELRSEF